MSVTYASQTKVNKKSVRYSQGNTPPAIDTLDVIFADADKKCEAAGFKEPTTESIVEFCDDVKQERTKEAAEV